MGGDEGRDVANAGGADGEAPGAQKSGDRGRRRTKGRLLTLQIRVHDFLRGLAIGSVRLEQGECSGFRFGFLIIGEIWFSQNRNRLV